MWVLLLGVAEAALLYTLKVTGTYPHDTTSFTYSPNSEGLYFAGDGTLVESTGRYGQSSLRRVDLQTGTTLQEQALAADLFGSC
mmetsp:Transcript_11440/g.22440  ORF Transcript_11440/g.22440 Transcript_11440/m.22440 type:complete len:84 (+) Transcript_11440:1832-2083(+)